MDPYRETSAHVPPIYEAPAPSHQSDPARQHPPDGHGLARAGCIAALVAVLVASVVGLVAGYAGARLASMDGTSDPTAGTITVIEGTTDEPVAAVAAAAVQSVVNIDITATRPADDGEALPEDHPGIPVLGNGSGVAYKSDSDGGTFILTNDHVVSDATRIVVTDSAGEKHSGTVVGVDINTDIAVVHVHVVIPTIELGDSDDLAVGSLVVAIGSPFGLQQSVTSGVISAIGRSLPDSSSQSGVYPLVDVIQTDASINPGNSGGALLDRQGRLIGINTAIFSDTGVNGGIGFAVPVNTVVRVADEIIATGHAQAPFLGIVGQTVTELLAEEEGLPVTEGAIVVEITGDTGAEDAGIRPDDIIVGFDGSVIRSMDDLILAVRKTSVGDEKTIELYRGQERMDLTIVVGVKPDTFELPAEE